jgi:hypothetical protein
MIFGSDNTGPSFLRGEDMAPPHYSVKNNKVRLEQLNKELKDMVEYATEKWWWLDFLFPFSYHILQLYTLLSSLHSYMGFLT